MKDSTFIAESLVRLSQLQADHFEYAMKLRDQEVQELKAEVERLRQNAAYLEARLFRIGGTA